MTALSDDIKLLIVVLILLFAPSMVEATFNKVEQHQREELAVGGNNYKRASQKADFERIGTIARRDIERKQPPRFTFIRTNEG